MDKRGLVIIICVLGILVAGYLAYMYYSGDHSVCDINETFDCTTVHDSDYALFFGIPVAVIGFIGYLMIVLFAVWKFDFVKWFALIGSIFHLRLTYAEFFVIHKFCVFCLVSQVLILLILALSIQWKRYLKK